MIDTMVVVGAAGDLTARLLLPALATLRESGALGPGFRFVGAGEQNWTSAEFARHAQDRLARHAPHITPAHRDALAAELQYRQVDVTDPASVSALIDAVRAGSQSEPIAVYLALPTQLMLGTVRALIDSRLAPGSRIAVEKPFGHDLPSALELNAALRRLDDSAVYRIDHALAMTAVQALAEAHRPGTDRPVEWNGDRIDRVELLWEETLALEGRAAFYDRAGALRDVVQNHLLQILGTIVPLRSVRPPDARAVRERTRRAWYTAGEIVGDDDQVTTVPDYAVEDGVDPRRQTETFAELVLEVDSPQWRDTAFVLRAGKALAARRRGVRVHFTAGGSAWFDVDDVDEPGGAEPAAYRRIIADLLDGGSSYAVSAAEAELGWRIVQPVLRGWADDAVPLRSYPAGSDGTMSP